jgi:hypothetical protein
LGLVSKADTHAAGPVVSQECIGKRTDNTLDWTIGTGMIDRHLNMT